MGLSPKLWEHLTGRVIGPGNPASLLRDPGSVRGVRDIVHTWRDASLNCRRRHAYRVDAQKNEREIVRRKDEKEIVRPDGTRWVHWDRSYTMEG